jgi:hypothetical protein
MTTLATLIDQTLNEILLGTYRAHQNVLTNTIGSTDTAITLSYPIDAVGEGSYLEIDQELMYVIPGGVNGPAKTLTIQRKVRGTSAATHAAGAPVFINPRFPRFNVLSTMREEVLSWPQNIYRVELLSTVVPHFTSGISVQSLTTHEVTTIKNVWQIRTGDVDNRMVRMSGWRYEKELGTIWLRQKANTYADTYEILAGTKIDPANMAPGWQESADVGLIGVTDSMVDILKYGSAWRLVQGREPKRLFTEEENESRTAQDVPVQANTALAAQLKKLRDTRLGEEMFRLRSNNGIRG